MHRLVKEHLEIIISFLDDDSYSNPNYQKYSMATYGLSIEEYSKVFQGFDILGKLTLVVKAFDWFDSDSLDKFIELNKDVIHFGEITELINLLNFPNDRIKNTKEAISLLEELLRDKIRENTIEEILL